jgi:hypothetical protein
MTEPRASQSDLTQRRPFAGTAVWVTDATLAPLSR